MTLEIWKEHKRIRPCPVSPPDIRAQVEAARNDLAQAAVGGLSTPWRLAIAYEGARKFAAAALAAMGYRVAGGAGHHYYTIQSLRYTVKLDPQAVRLLDAFREKRNDMTYDVAAPPSEKEAAEMAALASDVAERVTEWLRREHAGILAED